MANLNDTTMTVVPCVINVPTQLDPLDPTIMPMQIMLFSQADPDQGNQSFPIDLFGSLMTLTENIDAVEEMVDEALTLSEEYAPYAGGGSTALGEGQSMEQAFARLEARVIALETP